MNEQEIQDRFRYHPIEPGNGSRAQAHEVVRTASEDLNRRQVVGAAVATPVLLCASGRRFEAARGDGACVLLVLLCRPREVVSARDWPDLEETRAAELSRGRSVVGTAERSCEPAKLVVSEPASDAEAATYRASELVRKAFAGEREWAGDLEAVVALGPGETADLSWLMTSPDRVRDRVARLERGLAELRAEMSERETEYGAALVDVRADQSKLLEACRASIDERVVDLVGSQGRTLADCAAKLR